MVCGTIQPGDIRFPSLRNSQHRYPLTLRPVLIGFAYVCVRPLNPLINSPTRQHDYSLESVPNMIVRFRKQFLLSFLKIF